jgi:hypothetical protein
MEGLCVIEGVRLGEDDFSKTVNKRRRVEWIGK